MQLVSIEKGGNLVQTAYYSFKWYDRFPLGFGDVKGR